MLVSTANKPNGWNHSTTSGCGELVLNIYRLENGQIINHPKWNGKKWKYQTIEQLDAIRRTCDKIGLLCGSLMVY